VSVDPDGLGHIVLRGGWLTASCCVLPELRAWAAQHLNTSDLLVSVPQQQFLFVMSKGDAAFRADMRRYIKVAVDGMDKLITFDLFALTPEGLMPFAGE
jgi:hypothetical protein